MLILMAKSLILNLMFFRSVTKVKGSPTKFFCWKLVKKFSFKNQPRFLYLLICHTKHNSSYPRIQTAIHTQRMLKYICTLINVALSVPAYKKSTSLLSDGSKSQSLLTVHTPCIPWLKGGEGLSYSQDIMQSNYSQNRCLQTWFSRPWTAKEYGLEISTP